MVTGSKVDELARRVSHAMFAERDTVEQAFQYADTIANATGSPIHVWAAVRVVANTIAVAMLAARDADLAAAAIAEHEATEASAEFLVNFHEDPGHGWAAVPLASLMGYGIAATRFSRYSYLDNRGGRPTVYLEEDCDFPKFVEIMADKGIDVIVEQTFDSKGDSFIRRLPSLHARADDAKR